MYTDRGDRLCNRPFSQLSVLRDLDLDLDLESGHMAYRRGRSSHRPLRPIKFRWNRKTFGDRDGRARDIENLRPATGFIRSAQKSRSKSKYFRWWNDVCGTGRCRWLFASWFDVNRFTSDEDLREKRFFFHFRSQLPWPLTLKLLPCSYSCLALCFHRIITFYGFPVLRKSETPNRRTDRQVATLNAAPRERGPHNNLSNCRSVRPIGLRSHDCL